MEDAVVALQSAIDELRMAQETLPDDLSQEVAKVIQQTSALLEAVRQKIQTSS